MARRVLGVLVGLWSGIAGADELSRTLASQVVSESEPPAFPAYKLSTSEFNVVWEGPPLASVSAELVPNTVEWVRVDDVLVVPRGRVRLKTQGVKGNVRASDRIYPLGATDTTELQVMLVSGPGNPIDITIDRDGQLEAGRLLLKRVPGGNPEGTRVHIDPSCFPQYVDARLIGSQGADWISMGCRKIWEKGGKQRTQALEIVILWDSGTQAIELGGAQVPAELAPVWTLTLSPKDHALTIGNEEGRSLVITNQLKETAHFLRLGFGVGGVMQRLGVQNPQGTLVWSNFQPTSDLEVLGSYILSDDVHIVMFTATTLDRRFDTDLGVYLKYESLKILDRRVSTTVLIGGHATLYRQPVFDSNGNLTSHDGNFTYFIDVPQGLEVKLSDAILKRYDFRTGFFYYPVLNGKGFISAWARWGGSDFFVQLNYLNWHQTLQDANQTPVTLQSFSVSVGRASWLGWL